MLIQGKKALIFGVANDRSIAYAIARELKNNGASIALFIWSTDRKSVV